MGRVRFYTQDGEHYCTLRVESDGLYLLGDKVRIHAERSKMPPIKQYASREAETSTEFYARLDDPDCLQHILAVLEDLEYTFRLDPKAMATFKPAYKKSGHELSVKYRDDWHTQSGASLLEALIVYYREVVSEAEPPPTPLRKGGRDRAAE